jgi:hypothetical protein
MERKVKTLGMSDLAFKSSIERALDALYKRREQLERLIEHLESTSLRRLQGSPRKPSEPQQ